jgi:hypothetical protein
MTGPNAVQHDFSSANDTIFDIGNRYLGTVRQKYLRGAE